MARSPALALGPRPPLTWAATVLILARLLATPTGAQSSRTPWWRTAVIYNVEVRSFLDSDGDGLGDINGVTQKLTYVHELGANALRLSGVLRRGRRGCPAGAGTADFKAPDPALGNADDLERLMKAAREIGLHLIIDIEPNHSSDDHEWFLNSVKRKEPFTDYYVWKDGISRTINGSKILGPPNNWLSVFGGSAWEWSTERKQYYLHQFGPQQPDLNYRNPKVVEEMRDVVKFWLEKGVSGFTMKDVSYLFEDSQFRNETEIHDLNHSSNDYFSLQHSYTKDVNETFSIIEQWRQMMEMFASKKDRIPRLLMVEADNENVMKYYGTSVTQTGGANFPINFFLTSMLSNKSKAMDYSEAIHRWNIYMHDGRWPNWMLGCAGVSRVASRISSNLVDALNMMVMLLPGTALSYSGEEIGMTDNEQIMWNNLSTFTACYDKPGYWNQLKIKYPSQTPFHWDSSTSAGFSTNSITWLPINPNFKSVNLHHQRVISRSHYKVYRRLVAMREEPAIHKGQLASHVLSDFVFSFSRSTPDKDTFVVVINFGPNTIEVNLKPYNLPKVVLIHTPSVNSKYRMSDRVHSKKLELQPYTSVVVTTGKAHEYKYSSGNFSYASVPHIIILFCTSIFIKYFLV